MRWRRDSGANASAQRHKRLPLDFHDAFAALGLVAQIVRDLVDYLVDVVHVDAP